MCLTEQKNIQEYTIITNKAAHGGKGAIVAIIKGTKVEDVVKALMRILKFFAK